MPFLLDRLLYMTFYKGKYFSKKENHKQDEFTISFAMTINLPIFFFSFQSCFNKLIFIANIIECSVLHSHIYLIINNFHEKYNHPLINNSKFLSAMSEIQK